MAQFIVAGQRHVPYLGAVAVISLVPRSGKVEDNYGAAIRRYWIGCGSPPGLIVVERDIAVGLGQWYLLRRLINWRPDYVWTLPYPLYPLSTGRPAAVWSVRGVDDQGRWQYLPARLPPPPRAAAFSLGCTYLPARLLARELEAAINWDYPNTDTALSHRANELRIPIGVVSTPIVHLHYEVPALYLEAGGGNCRS